MSAKSIALKMGGTATSLLPISVWLGVKEFKYKETGNDIRKLTSRPYEDVLSSLTQLDELVEASEYIDEKPSIKEHRKNDYFYYFSVNVEIDGKNYKYIFTFTSALSLLNGMMFPSISFPSTTI